MADELGGHWPVGLTCLHGGPGAGKSVMCNQALLSADCPATYVTCEMSLPSVGRRIIANETGRYLERLDSSVTKPYLPAPGPPRRKVGFFNCLGTSNDPQSEFSLSADACRSCGGSAGGLRGRSPRHGQLDVGKSGVEIRLPSVRRSCSVVSTRGSRP
jgi:hypothetical protein